MENNQNTNEQIEVQEINDPIRPFTVRTKESLKEAFKSIEAKTDNDKLAKLIELYEKFQATQDKFNVDSNIDIISKAMRTIESQIGAIASSVNQYERTLNENYIVGVADEMKILKDKIESEEVLNARIISLEKEIELLTKRYEDKEQIVFQSKEKIENLEADNKKYIALNSELVSKENTYINELREKDSEIDTLAREYNTMKASLNEKFNNELKELKEDLEKELDVKVKEINEKNKNINVLEKEKIELNSNIENYRNLYNASKDEVEYFKTSLENLKIKNAEEIKDLNTSHTNTLNQVRNNYTEDIKELKNEIKGLEIKKEAELKELRINHEKEIKEVSKQAQSEREALRNQAESEKEVLRNQINDLRSKEAGLSSKIASLSSKVEGKDENIKLLNDRNKSLEQELNKYKDNFHKALGEREILMKEQYADREKIKSLEEELTQLKKQLEK